MIFTTKDTERAEREKRKFASLILKLSPGNAIAFKAPIDKPQRAGRVLDLKSQLTLDEGIKRELPDQKIRQELRG